MKMLIGATGCGIQEAYAEPSNNAVVFLLPDTLL